MSLIVPRTVTPINGASRPLTRFRKKRALVLLGDPGAGKTTEFREAAGAKDAAAEAEDAVYVTARQFARTDVARRPKWRNTTLFIDGLDELRSGDGDPRRPLDAILARLECLDWPRVRISCRSSAWLGMNDTREITSEPRYRDLVLLHLDPLNDNDVRRILDSRKIASREAILASARDLGFDRLLLNPLTLDLWIKATSADGRQPASRREIFAIACRHMIAEHNDQHLATHSSAPRSPSDTIAAASHLALYFLLSGAERIVRTANLGTEDIAHVANLGTRHIAQAVNPGDHQWDGLRVEDIPTNGLGSSDRPRLDSCALTHALGTRLFTTHWLFTTHQLFTTHRSAGCSAEATAFVPVHRSVAEYLAARRLHDCIEGGVPFGRVLALLIGGDGVVVPSLRGIAAWLATLNADARPRLVEQAPLDILTVGDPADFPPEHTRGLVLSLKEHARDTGFVSVPTQASWAATLVNANTLSLLRRCIDGKRPSDEVHAVMELLLDCLALHPAPPSLFSHADAIEVVKDGRWWFRVRKRALRAAIAMAGRDHAAFPALRGVLSDVANGRVEDTSQELRGLLIGALYPTHLSARELGTILPSTFGPILAWHLRTALLERTPESAVGDLLDVLQADPEGLTDAIGPDAVIKLLDRAVLTGGDAVQIETLYDWLSLHPDPGRRSPGVAPAWLYRHRNRWNGLLREHVRRRELGSEFSWRVPVLLFRELSSSDASQRCLEAATAVAATTADCHDDVGGYLELAFTTRPLNLDLDEWLQWATRHVRGQPLLVERLECLVAAYVDQQQTFATQMPRHGEAVERVILQRRAAVLASDPSPSVLREVAAHYLRIPPHEPLAEWLDHDVQAIDAALLALRELPPSADLPGLSELLRLDQQRATSPLAYPFLAGLQELGDQGGVVLAELDDKQLRGALGVYFLTLLINKSVPDWFADLLVTRPELVAEVFVEVHVAWIRGRRGHHEHLAHLASTEHAAVARLVVPKLLAIFPVRGTKWHLSWMRLVVEAAVRHLPEDEVLATVQRRLAFGSMDVAQRAFWLATGLRLRPREFLGRMIRFLDRGNQAQSRRRAESCIADIARAAGLPGKIGVAGACALIRVFGNRYSPDGLGHRLSDSNTGFVRVAEEDEVREQAAHLVQRCVDHLSRESKRSASRALELLARDPTLASWYDALRHARRHQAERRREVSHRHPSLAEIADVMRCGPPANAYDLAEVTADLLDGVAREVRDGSADGWRLFWNEGSAGKTAANARHEVSWSPKHENSCRDALLLLLRPHLARRRADAQPEARYAEGRRADIRVSCPGGTVAIPIEIKKDSHPELWSAIDAQLVRKYARDPASGGHGIYLVLWFGDRCVVPRTGNRPKSPAELIDRLRQQLSAQQRRFVRVIVLDVSRPQAVQGGEASKPS